MCWLAGGKEGMHGARRPGGGAALLLRRRTKNKRGGAAPRASRSAQASPNLQPPGPPRQRAPGGQHAQDMLNQLRDQGKAGGRQGRAGAPHGFFSSVDAERRCCGGGERALALKLQQALASCLLPWAPPPPQRMVQISDPGLSRSLQRGAGPQGSQEGLGERGNNARCRSDHFGRRWRSVCGYRDPEGRAKSKLATYFVEWGNRSGVRAEEQGENAIKI